MTDTNIPDDMLANGGKSAAVLERVPADDVMRLRVDVLEDLLGQVVRHIQATAGVTLMPKSQLAAIAAEATRDLPAPATLDELEALPVGARYKDHYGIVRVK